MANRIQLRRDIQVNWERVDPILEDGEPGLDITQNKIKYGDGTTPWTLLPYANASGSVSFDYSTVQEGESGPIDVTSITGNPGVGVSLTSDEWAQLMWTPNTANVTIDTISDGGNVYNWAYVDDSGFRIENDTGTDNYQWQFTTTGNLTLPDSGIIGTGTSSYIQIPADGFDTGQPLTILNNVGNKVSLVANNKNWQFDSVGNLSLPSGGAINYANGVSILSNIGSTVSTGNIVFNGTDVGLDAGTLAVGSVLTIAPNLEGQAYLQLPNDISANVTNTRLWNRIGNVEIGSGRSGPGGSVQVWYFDQDGKLILPNGNFFQSQNGQGETNIQIIDNTSSFKIYTHASVNAQAWVFNADGSTVFPDHSNVSITGNLTVGNLTVNGTTTTISTNSYVVTDNIVQFADGNPADTLDVGFVAHRTVGSTLEHTGLVRDASDGNWKLFSNVAAQPGTTVDFTNVVYDDLVVGNISSPTITAINNTLANVSTYSNVNVASYLPTYTGAITASNLRINRASPSVSTGGAGDLRGTITADTNYLYYAVDTYGNGTYSVVMATSNNGSVYYHDIVKGDYPEPKASWSLSVSGVDLLVESVTDGGSYWRLNSNTSTGYSAGDSANLTGNSGTVWKSIPLTTFQTGAYGNTQVAQYLTTNPQAGTYSNANVASYLPTYSGNVTANFANVSSLTVNGTTTVAAINEKFVSNASPASLANVAIDFSQTAIVYVTTPSGNITANIQNFSIPSGTISSVTVWISQGVTPYVANSVQINNAMQTVKWQGSATAPAGNASKQDVISFTILNSSGTYTVLGQLATFG